jgi:hypothetical protein
METGFQPAHNQLWMQSRQPWSGVGSSSFVIQRLEPGLRTKSLYETPLWLEQKPCVACATARATG